jgi:hypothetical protein
VYRFAPKSLLKNSPWRKSMLIIIIIYGNQIIEKNSFSFTQEIMD